MTSRILLIAGLGIVGTLIRYQAGRWALGSAWNDSAASSLPWHTIGVNLVGSFLIGVVYSLPTDLLSGSWKVVLGVGLLGALTTFSGVMWEAFTMIESGRVVAATGYLIGSLIAGLCLLAAGAYLTRAITG